MHRFFQCRLFRYVGKLLHSALRFHATVASALCSQTTATVFPLVGQGAGGGHFRNGLHESGDSRVLVPHSQRDAVTSVGKQSLELRYALLEGVVFAQEHDKLVFGGNSASSGSVLDPALTAEQALELGRRGVVETTHASPVALVPHVLSAHVPGKMAYIDVPGASRETEVVGESPRPQEILLVLSLGVDQLAVVAGAALLLEVSTEDGATQSNAFVERVHLRDVLEVAACPADTLTAQKIDAQVRKEQLLAISRVERRSKEPLFEEMFLFLLGSVDILAKLAIARVVLKVVTEDLLHETAAILWVFNRLYVFQSALAPLRTGSLQKIYAVVTESDGLAVGRSSTGRGGRSLAYLWRTAVVGELGVVTFISFVTTAPTKPSSSSSSPSPTSPSPPTTPPSATPSPSPRGASAVGRLLHRHIRLLIGRPILHTFKHRLRNGTREKKFIFFATRHVQELAPAPRAHTPVLKVVAELDFGHYLSLVYRLDEIHVRLGALCPARTVATHEIHANRHTFHLAPLCRWVFRLVYRSCSCALVPIAALFLVIFRVHTRLPPGAHHPAVAAIIASSAAARISTNAAAKPVAVISRVAAVVAVGAIGTSGRHFCHTQKSKKQCMCWEELRMRINAMPSARRARSRNRAAS